MARVLWLSGGRRNDSCSGQWVAGCGVGHGCVLYSGGGFARGQGNAVGGATGDPADVEFSQG